MFELVNNLCGIEFKAWETNDNFYDSEYIFTEFRRHVKSHTQEYWELLRDIPEYSPENFEETLVIKLEHILSEARWKILPEI